MNQIYVKKKHEIIHQKQKIGEIVGETRFSLFVWEVVPSQFPTMI